MEKLELAVLLSETPKKIDNKDDKGISPLWKGHIGTETGDEVEAFIKLIPLQEILSEVVCALAGRVLSLPIPRPFVVIDTENHLGQGHNRILFASENAGHPSFKRRILNGEKWVYDALLNWKQIHDAAVFDDWIANIDRNQGNLLVGGEDDFAIIDHGRALGAPDSVPSNFKAYLTNMLAQVIINHGKDIGAAKFRKRATANAEKCAGLDYQELKKNCRAAIYGMSERLEMVLYFLSQRAQFLPSLASRRGGQQELDL